MCGFVPKVVMIFGLIFCLCSCATPQMYPPDFSKKIEVKGYFGPSLLQDEKLIDLDEFKKHPDSRVRQKHASLTQTYNYYLIAGLGSTGLLIYAGATDYREL